MFALIRAWTDGLLSDVGCAKPWSNRPLPRPLFENEERAFSVISLLSLGMKNKVQKLMTSKRNHINFSISDFINSKDKPQIQIYSSESLVDENNIISFSDQAAIVTHYLNLKGKPAAKNYESKARSLVESWLLWAEDSEEYCYKVKESLDAFSLDLFKEFKKVPFPPIKKPQFTFIDLFAGIGGFRLAMQDCGGECVYSSEWDENAKRTYYYNFGEVPFGDITKELNKQFIPDGFDVLCAGFPCQAFSIAGYRKGFEDTRGTLFFDVAEIIKRKHPKAVYLENVKNLYTHDNGKTYAVIKGTLEELGYVVFDKVMNAMEYANIPQNRERIFIVCFDREQVPNYGDFMFPEKVPLKSTIKDCIDYSIHDKKLFYGNSMGHIAEIRAGVTSKETIYQWRRQYVRENKSNVCPTLTANMGTGGHNVPLILTDEGIRKLSPKECLNFQGYPKKYQFPITIADSAKYKQAGNSVVVPLIKSVCQNIVTTLLPHS